MRPPFSYSPHRATEDATALALALVAAGYQTREAQAEYLGLGASTLTRWLRSWSVGWRPRRIGGAPSVALSRVLDRELDANVRSALEDPGQWGENAVHP